MGRRRARGGPGAVGIASLWLAALAGAGGAQPFPDETAGEAPAPELPDDSFEGAFEPAEAEIEPEGDLDLAIPSGPPGTLLEQLLALHDPAHFRGCGEGGHIVLNEVCAVGIECDRDVRRRDFVEVYNPGRGDVELACYALSARDEVVFSPSGRLEGGGIRAFGELEMGFRLAKRDDFVVLYRLGVDLDGGPTIAEAERVSIDEMGAHAYRIPDGGFWQTYTVEEAEQGWPGTFGESNEGADRATSGSMRRSPEPPP